jgi:hypothetical protein
MQLMCQRLKLQLQLVNCPFDGLGNSPSGWDLGESSAMVALNRCNTGQYENLRTAVSTSTQSIYTPTDNKQQTLMRLETISRLVMCYRRKKKREIWGNIIISHTVSHTLKWSSWHNLCATWQKTDRYTAVRQRHLPLLDKWLNESSAVWKIEKMATKCVWTPSRQMMRIQLSQTWKHDHIASRCRCMHMPISQHPAKTLISCVYQVTMCFADVPAFIVEFEWSPASALHEFKDPHGNDVGHFALCCWFIVCLEGRVCFVDLVVKYISVTISLSGAAASHADCTSCSLCEAWSRS